MRTSKRKLAFIPNPLDSTLKSSIGIVTYELATRLSDDYDVYIYTSKANGPAAPNLPGLNFRLTSATTNGLNRLTNNGSRHSLAKTGRERVSELFNWDRMALTLGGYYKELLETSAAPANRGPASCAKKAGRRY